MNRPTARRRLHLVGTALAIVLVTAFGSSTVSAADGVASRPTTPDDGFDAGRWTLSLYAGYDRECSSDPQIGYGAVGVGYFAFDGFSVNAEARTYGSSQEGEDATVFALDLLIRHHIIRRDRWSIFVDASAGVSEATHRIPAGGTNFNFIEEAGVGATYKLSDTVHLIGGVRYFHLSNARLRGADENPGLNGVGGYVGLLFEL